MGGGTVDGARGRVEGDGGVGAGAGVGVGAGCGVDWAVGRVN